MGRAEEGGFGGNFIWGYLRGYAGFKALLVNC